MNPCASIVANAEIYINAYLNSSLTATGRIFWGVDDNRVVKGVLLPPQDRDTVQKRVAESLSAAEPYISPDLYFIRFHQVFTEGGSAVEDTFIVEIGVVPYRSSRLFATSKGEVYIKTAGGKEKLSPLQIQEQILLRAQGSARR
ncbi:MAG: ATP-binding protein [Oscillospiraceae bacterium]|nr:ATP-binding protein [Oscillospiraceae bacterium]